MQQSDHNECTTRTSPSNTYPQHAAGRVERRTQFLGQRAGSTRNAGLLLPEEGVSALKRPTKYEKNKLAFAMTRLRGPSPAPSRPVALGAELEAHRDWLRIANNYSRLGLWKWHGEVTRECGVTAKDRSYCSSAPTMNAELRAVLAFNDSRTLGRVCGSAEKCAADG